jgi:signal transduction histidine kinase
MNKNRPFWNKPRPLSAWLTFGVGTFALVGSLALVVFFQHRARLEEEVSLESLGRNNALFMDQARLPQTEQMAGRLGRVMGARVEFRDSDKASGYGVVRRLGDEMTVGFPLRNGREVWFTRDAGAAVAKPFWQRWDAVLVLAGFWALAWGFSRWLARRVTRPLSRLAAVLPEVGGERRLEGLPAEGPAEIVSLADGLRQTQDAILASREELRHAERLALLGKMTTSLAHEVRNPVSAIRLHAQLMERALGETDRASATLIVAEAGRIESLVSQWMHFAKPAPVKMEPVDVGALADETRRLMEPQAAHAGVRITLETDERWASIPVNGDRERLRQVFGNLLLNAIQSMPKGGTATIRVLPGAVEFHDEGGGFSKRALEHFGEPFHSDREGGMGLGLAVSKEVVEAHGGSLAVENSNNGGAKVTIRWSSFHHTA